SEGRAADKFANFPHDASSARNRAAARTSARLFFGYFLLAKQKKVPRPPGRDPAKPPSRRKTRRNPNKHGSIPPYSPLVFQPDFHNLSHPPSEPAPWNLPVRTRTYPRRRSA